MVVRNWNDVPPVIAHDYAIVWHIFGERGSEGRTYEEAPLEGMNTFLRQMMQGGVEEDYHKHDDREQLYYITRGHGKVRIDERTYEVKEGDAVHIPLGSMHQLMNDSDDWIEHILVSAPVKRP